jgi:hypothetical protein
VMPSFDPTMEGPFFMAQCPVLMVT